MEINPVTEEIYYLRKLTDLVGADNSVSDFNSQKRLKRNPLRIFHRQLNFFKKISSFFAAGVSSSYSISKKTVKYEQKSFCGNRFDLKIE